MAAGFFAVGSSPLTRGKPSRASRWVRRVRLIPAHAGKTRCRRRPCRPRPAHPRSRGENWETFILDEASGGSSPLTRGKLACGLARRGRGRLIPAHAGKTSSVISCSFSFAAHPRSRGENADRHDAGHDACRLIPAHAGKTVYTVAYRISAAAHPRSRGENALRMSTPILPSGSSPLTRGKPDSGAQGAFWGRLIPAHAGKTREFNRETDSHAAHPRSRGENQLTVDPTVFDDGSSPLTRGKPFAGSGAMVGVRLIPAHAGKTSPCQRRAWPQPAHPRSRGENSEPLSCAPLIHGSSPLTRGKLRRPAQQLRPARLIPAHAGKTAGSLSAHHPRTAHPRSRGENVGAHRPGEPVGGSSPLTRGKLGGGRRRLHRSAAHPRSRGENVKRTLVDWTLAGSSPLTRGKRDRARRRARHRRLIPAHAGKTPCSKARSASPPAHPRSRGENDEVVAGQLHGGGSSPLTRGKHFLTCAFIAQIDQILESLELCASSESYSLRDAYATDVLQDQVRSIGLAPLSSRGAS